MFPPQGGPLERSGSGGDSVARGVGCSQDGPLLLTTTVLVAAGSAGLLLWLWLLQLLRLGPWCCWSVVCGPRVAAPVGRGLAGVCDFGWLLRLGQPVGSVGFMSTNYYLHYNRCGCCDRFDVLHVCKSFRTWHAPVVDGKVLLSSFQDWKGFLQWHVDDGAAIEDEYGDVVSLPWFLQQAVPNRVQYDWCVQHGELTDRVEPGHTFLDNEGFCFYAGEFS